MESNPTMLFVVKSLAAEELVLKLSPTMKTLGDLHGEVGKRWSLPRHLQRFCSQGRSYWAHADATPLAELLPSHVDAQVIPIIFLLWLKDEDRIDILGSAGMFMRDREEFKLREAEERGEMIHTVSLGEWKSVCVKAITEWMRFTGDVWSFD